MSTIKKNIYLLRHAKSDHSNGMDDHERPLNARGRKDALNMGKHMASTLTLPDMVLCSTSVRTQETWKCISQSFSQAPAVQCVKGLYLATPGEMIKEIGKLAEDITSVMVIAHNPGIHQLSVLLTGHITHERNYGAMRLKFPTCALAVLSATIPSWQSLEPGICTLERFVTPGDL